MEKARGQITITDVYDGEDGYSIVAVYRRSDAQPPAPTGTALPPEGWHADPAAATDSYATSGSFTDDSSMQGWRVARGNNAASVLIRDRVAVNAASEITFDIEMKASSQAGYDYLYVGLVDVAVTSRPINLSSAVTNSERCVSGTQQKTLSVTVPAGSHFFDVVYTKNASTNSNSDSVWYRIAGFPTAAPLWQSQSRERGGMTDGTWTTPVRVTPENGTKRWIQMTPQNVTTDPDGMLAVTGASYITLSFWEQEGDGTPVKVTDSERIGREVVVDGYVNVDNPIDGGWTIDEYVSINDYFVPQADGDWKSDSPLAVGGQFKFFYVVWLADGSQVDASPYYDRKDMVVVPGGSSTWQLIVTPGIIKLNARGQVASSQDITFSALRADGMKLSTESDFHGAMFDIELGEGFPAEGDRLLADEYDHDGMTFSLQDMQPDISGELVSFGLYDINLGATVAVATLPVLRDGEGGHIGKAMWPAGTYENKKYESDEYSTPLVHVLNGTTDEWYYLIAATNEWGVGGNPAKPSTGAYAGYEYIPPVSAYSTVWGKALSDYRVIMTEALFTDFAKMGSAVIRGDFLMSMNGKVGSVVIKDGGDGGDGRPAYMRFAGNPSSLDAYSFRFSGNGYTSASPRMLCRFVPTKGGAVTITASGLCTMGIRPVGAVSYASTFSVATLVGATATRQVTLSAGVKYELLCYGNNSVTSFSVTGNITFPSGTMGLMPAMDDGFFYPCWWVDLRTGEMSGANGNFVLHADGSITAAAGNFTIDEEGNVAVAGTVRATVLYTTLRHLHIGQQAYCTEVGELVDWGYNNTTTIAYSLNSKQLLTALGGALPRVLILACTDDLSAVETDSPDNASVPYFHVTLPAAGDFQGHELEVCGFVRSYKENVRSYRMHRVVQLSCDDGTFATMARQWNDQATESIRPVSGTGFVNAEGGNVPVWRVRLISTQYDSKWRWETIEMQNCEYVSSY